jgi:hypothetical protein
LSGEKSFSSLIAFCKVIGISDSIFHSWKAILKTEAEWRASRNVDILCKGTWLTNKNTSSSRIFTKILLINIFIAAMQISNRFASFLLETLIRLRE